MRNEIAKLTGLERLFFWLAPWFLLVDMLNGALLQGGGHSGGLSMLYKGALIVIMYLSLWQRRQDQAWQLPLLGGLLMLGPLLSYSQTGHLLWLAELQLVSKVLALILAFYYVKTLALQAPSVCSQLLQRLMLISFLVVLANLLLGMLGFGYTAYQPMDAVQQRFLGYKGFFYSTNELSALWLILSCWALLCCWPRGKALYVLVSIVCVSCAALMLTKTGVLGCLALVLLVPLLLQNGRWWQQTRGWVGVLLLLGLLLCFLLLWYGPVILQWAGIWDKWLYAYQQRGLAGIVLSSRDLYLSRSLQTLMSEYPGWQLLFGVGVSGMQLYLKKYFVELDLFDLWIFYGLAGVLVFVWSFSLLFWHNWHCRQRTQMKVILLLNILLLLVSLLAGHVLTSGMLWLPWALLNISLLLPGGIGGKDERST